MAWRRISPGTSRAASTCGSTRSSFHDGEADRTRFLERDLLRHAEVREHLALEHVLHLIAAVQPRHQAADAADEIGAHDDVELGLALRRHHERLVAVALGEAV